MIMITRDCEACTHPGNPAFHSAICNHHHHLHWQAGAGSSLFPIRNVDISKSNSTTNQFEPSSLSPWLSASSSKWMFGRVVDPRSKAIQRRNRATLLARATALAIDPLFFYALTVGIITSSISTAGNSAASSSTSACLYVDGGLLAALTALRTCVDAVHVWHVWLQLRLAYVSRESLVVGCGKLVWNARAIAIHYLSSIRGFWFDLFVILPIPQMVFWLVVPRLIRKEAVVMMLSLILLIFLFQFLPKVYHSIFLMKKMQKVTGYVFGTIWWGFALNLLAYFIASHVVGCCWYILAIQRVASCLHQQCQMNGTCNTRPLSCSKEICYKSPQPSNFMDFSCFGNQTTSITSTSVIPDCLDTKSTFRFGIYRWALPVITSNSLAVKILYPIFWGLMALSTFGNVLEPTSQLLEVIFSIAIVLSGLLLFTLLIGNIQVFLHSVMARKRMMQLRSRDLEWWMKRRQLPTRLRQRVQHHERQRWVTMRGEDEMSMIKDVPQGLRRDIKRHLCLYLIKQIPLFNDLDDLILDNICDRVKPLVFSEDEKIIREGDPVQRMVFIVRGELESTQKLSKGMVATCSLGPGNFLGDELLSWCLRRPFIDRLPPSSSTFTCLRPTEAFALDAADLKYITEHFRYKFANEKLKRTARHYSSSWRTWAAVNIQLAWRRYRKRMSQPIPDAQNVDDQDTCLRHYAAVFLSLRPHDHLE